MSNDKDRYQDEHKQNFRLTVSSRNCV